MTSIAPLLFALINTSSPYWAFGFPAAIVAVFGADLYVFRRRFSSSAGCLIFGLAFGATRSIFAGGSLFVAKVALPHEQSLAGGLFNTLTQVLIHTHSVAAASQQYQYPYLPCQSYPPKIGTSIGLALTSVVLDKTIAKKAHSLGVSVPPGGAASDNAPPEALLAGYRAAQWFNFAFVMVGLALAVVFLRDIGVIARKHQPMPKDSHAEGVVDMQESAREAKDGEAVAGLESPSRRRSLEKESEV